MSTTKQPTSRAERKTTPAPSSHPNGYQHVSSRNILPGQRSADTTAKLTPASQQDRPRRSASNKPLAAHPVAAKFLDHSIDNLSQVFSEPSRLGRFADAVKRKGFLSDRASADDTLLVTLDTLAFHMKFVEGNEEYHERCLDAFKLIKSDPQASDLDDWYDAIESITRNIKRLQTTAVSKDGSLKKSKTPTTDAEEFKTEQSLYLQNLKMYRLKFLAEEAMDLNMQNNHLMKGASDMLSGNKARGGERLRANISGNYSGEIMKRIGNNNDSAAR